MTTGDVMDSSAALLNDASKSLFTYVAQYPYLNIALQELQELFEENNIPSTNEVSAVITQTIGVTAITTSNGLPTNLVEIQSLGERTFGTSSAFSPMQRLEFLPNSPYQSGYNRFWAWRDQEIKLPGATSKLELQINYIKSLFTAAGTTGTETITTINSKTFLSYRTAALCAHFIGENEERAKELNQDAALALARTLNISTKGKQSIVTRRLPFMRRARIVT